jgi:hypothetical protein
MSTLTPEQRLKFLEKARAKKAQPDSKVDVLSQLEIAEGDKKKRKVEAARLSVAIRAKAPNLSAAVVDEATKAGGRHMLSLPLRISRGPWPGKARNTKIFWCWRRSCRKLMK